MDAIYLTSPEHRAAATAARQDIMPGIGAAAEKHAGRAHRDNGALPGIQLYVVVDGQIRRGQIDKRAVCGVHTVKPVVVV